MTIEAAVGRIQEIIGDRCHVSTAIRDQHARDESYHAAVRPDAVAFPQTTEEVSQIVKICNEEGCPIIPWGVGTSLEGHTIPIRGGITLDMGEMNNVLEVHQEDMDAVVQPGVTREQINEDLRATGLFFPVDPGANATLGGMAATRASGTTAVRYGTMRENVMALEVVLADGRIIRTGTRARKSSAGYDLTKLMIGSEGTLGIITELTVKLQGQPESITAAVCAFDTMESAVNTVITTIQMGVPMARIELIDAASIEAVNAYKGLTMPVQPHLFVEFHGSEAGTKEQAESFGEVAEDFGCVGFEWTASLEDRNRLWTARHQSYFAMMARHPGKRAMTTDVCVPISNLAVALMETIEDLEEAGLPAPMVGHAGDGNFHSAIMIDPENPEELAKAKALSHAMAQRALRLDGTCTGEHGVGMGKTKYMAEEHGDGWSVMADIKRVFDPNNILNPGKLVEVN
ncbi:MAG: FAD-binding oxidoreductase [Pikeienuella sp.]